MTISIQPITNIIDAPNSDRLVLIQLGSYQFIADKAMNYKLGDLVLTIPEEHNVSKYLPILNKYFNIPEDGIIRRVSLRGNISQGIIISPDLLSEMGFDINQLSINEDLCELLEISEYTRPIPEELLEVIEVYKHPLVKFHDCVYPVVSKIKIGDQVLITEKIHGSQGNLIKNKEGNIYISSKGLLKDKFVFQQEIENAYTKAFNKLLKNNNWIIESKDYIQVIGEVIPFQKGYSYGFIEPTILVFGLYINGKSVDYRNYFNKQDCVPLIYEGELKEEHFSYDDKTNRYSLLDGKTICEGHCISSVSSIPISNGEDKSKPIKVKSGKFLSKNKGEV